MTSVIQSWQRLAGWQQAAVVWLIAVIYIFFAGWLGGNLLPNLVGWGPGVPEPVKHNPSNVATLFVRWDSGYYLVIAQSGYSDLGAERAFFPLYPLLVRWLSMANGLPIWWNGLFISVTTFGIASVVFYAWVRADYSQELALLATALLCFSPVSFYFVAFYPEAIFLAVIIFSLYSAQRGWFVVSGISIALAGATRPSAFLLGFVLLTEVFIQRRMPKRAWAMAIIGALIAPLGALAYYSYLGRPNGIMAGMQAYNTLLDSEWDTKMTWPWELLYSAGSAILFGTDIAQDWFSRAYTLHDMLFALGGLGVALWAVRYLRLSAAVLLLLSILYIFMLHGPYGYAFDSAPRRLTVVAPVHLALALFVSRLMPNWRWGVVLASALWLAVLTAWFASGRFVS